MVRYNKATALSLLSIALLGSASASEWKVGRLLPAGGKATSQEDGLYVLAENVEGPALMLGCSERLGIQARIYLNGMTQSDVKLEKIRRVRTRSVEIATASTSVRRDPWAYLKLKGQLISVKPWQGRRIFNSVVKGEAVNLNVVKVGAFTMDLPAIDEEFELFANTCSATAPKPKNVDSAEP